MGRLWILLFLAALVAVNAQNEEDPKKDIWEYYDGVYDSSLYDDDELEPLAQPEGKLDDEYQIEDNRSAPSDDTAVKDDVLSNKPVDDKAVPAKEDKTVDSDAENKRVSEQPQENKEKALNVEQAQDGPKDNVATEPTKEIIEETQAILKEDRGNDFADDKIKVQNSVPEDIIEETKQILEETDNNFDEKDSDKDINADDAEKHVVEPLDDGKVSELEEDTVDKVYEDLNADLDKLMETWRKLGVDYEEPEENADDSFDSKEYDEKFDFSGEKRVLESRLKSMEYPASDEDDVDDDDDESDEEINEEIDDLVRKVVNGDNKLIEDTQFDENEEINEDESSEKDDGENDKEFNDNDDTIDKVADDIGIDEIVDTDELFKDVKEEKVDTADIKPLSQLPEDSSTTVDATNAPPTARVASTTEATRTISVTDLNPAQYDQIMAQFKMANSEALDLNDEMNRNIIPNRVTLKIDESTQITSPRFPLAYLRDTTVEWMITGEGLGIELNITQLALRGVAQDHLLIVPGGLDAANSRRDGLVFSFDMVEPRRYRFLDVDKMFIRFRSGPGLVMARNNFVLSLRMITEAPTSIEDEEPIPEPIIPEPIHAITLHMGGVTLQEFRSNLEQFRVLIADMATVYINDNEIDPGMNTTLEATQIIKTGLCNVNWPGHELCARVTFSVPLVYPEGQETRLTEEDLQSMWETWSTADPFAARLARMNMSEFSVPDDNSALLMWVLVGMAVLVVAVLVTLALWRYSCLENYSRMPAFSDRDSVYSAKQGLDLYPTPHQTLPPLYAENEYKWDDAKFEDATRVDLGGFTNKSYARDMYDLSSDDEVGTPRPQSKPGYVYQRTYEV